jgi:hypothetical protein
MLKRNGGVRSVASIVRRPVIILSAMYLGRLGLSQLRGRSFPVSIGRGIWRILPPLKGEVDRALAVLSGLAQYCWCILALGCRPGSGCPRPGVCECKRATSACTAYSSINRPGAKQTQVGAETSVGLDTCTQSSVASGATKTVFVARHLSGHDGAESSSWI